MLLTFDAAHGFRLLVVAARRWIEFVGQGCRSWRGLLLDAVERAELCGYTTSVV